MNFLNIGIVSRFDGKMTFPFFRFLYVGADDGYIEVFKQGEYGIFVDIDFSKGTV